MSIAVTCPQCRAPFEIPHDLADQPVRCHQCMHIFPLAAARQSADVSPAHIHAGLPPIASVVSAEEEPPAQSVPPRRVRPRSPFPLVSVLILALGLLTFLLVASLGFNAWILLFHDRRAIELQAVMRAEQQARQMQEQAQQNIEMARQQQRQAEQLKWQALQRENENLKRQLEVMQEQLDDAKRPSAKDEKK